MSSLTSRLRKGVLALGALVALMSTATAPAQAAPEATWNGTFANFPGSSWRGAWGVDGRGEFGFGNMKQSGGTLDVKYGKGSSAPSCTNCPTSGGGQFYQDLGKNGNGAMKNATTLYLKYDVRFPANFSWGRGGKLPGLYGGEPGQASGGNHGQAWSTRFMFRNGNKGEVYVYTPDGDGYGKDVGLGAWSFPADNKTHTIQQSVNRQTGQLTVWFDNQQVLSTKAVTGIGGIPFKGVFFSTFFGGHDTSWGPSHEVHSYFSNFAVSTAKM